MRYRYKESANGCVGALDIPTHVGRLTVAAVGDDRADALAKAALIAERIASDPILRAIMPPQAAAAIKAAKGLAAAAQRGTRTLRHFWRRIRGPGKKRLAEALHKEAARAESADVGWNPFRRKRKRKRRAMPPRQRPRAREPMPEPEPMEPDIDDTTDTTDTTTDAE